MDELVATTLSRPLFSATRRPAERAVPDRPADPELTNVRLTGIVVEPDRRTAIFAVQGAKPLVRSEGETVNDWHLDSIAPHEVTVTGPAGTTTLELKNDPNLARPVPQTQPVPATSAVRPRVPPVQPAVATNRPLFPTPPMGQPRPGATPPAASRTFLPIRHGRGIDENPAMNTLSIVSENCEVRRPRSEGRTSRVGSLPLSSWRA